MGRWFRRFCAVGYCALVFFLSSHAIPAPVAQYVVKGGDLVIHATEYGILAFLLYRLFSRETAVFFRKYTYRISWLFAVFYGLSDEIHQYFVPSRFMSMWDVLADAVGATLVLVIIKRRTKRGICCSK